MQYIEISKKITEALKLKGLMDTQAIVDENGVPFIIEINARLPSQTPTAVYHSSGINMVSLLLEAFVKGELTVPIIEPKQAVIFEHVQVQGNRISVKGEHVMGEAKNLRLEMNFFGADEAITNLSEDSSSGVATLIIRDNGKDKAYERLANVIEEIMAEYHLSKYQDDSPA
jgi:pyrrolysine biosynthesis protein PylC